MKKKIGEIYNKPIVTGDKNLVTKNEIHESSLGGNNGGSDSDVEYYAFADSFDQSSADELFGMLLQFVLFAASNVKGYNKMYGNIISTGFQEYYNYENTGGWTMEFKQFAVSPTFVANGYLESFMDIINGYKEDTGNDLSKFITPITKEEFYDLNNI